MSTITRRTMLKQSLAGSLALAAPFSRAQGANDDIRVAVVGLNNQGSNHINWFRALPGVRVTALCDADQAVLDREARKCGDRNQPVATYRDVRRLLENKDVDAVVTATPNHWHALVTVWSCQAGKDVYVEKPVSHDLWEGRQMVQAARTYRRIVQSGTQRRSDTGLREAIAWIREGHLGQITLVRGIIYVRRDSIGKVSGPQAPPASVDYDLWCGPAPRTPLMRKRLHYDWHWVWPTGNGDLGNNGIHFMDICRWVTEQQVLPPRVLSVGGRFGYDDDGETPNTQLVVLDYQPVPILFELRGLPRTREENAMDDYLGTRAGTVVHCEGGHFVGGWAYARNGQKVKQFARTGGAGHQANFIDAVRSRNPGDLHAEVREGHLSSALCHLGGISHRLGSAAPPGTVEERLQDAPGIPEAYERMQQHLLHNQVDLEQTPPVLGPWLTVNPEEERFTGPFAEEANALRRRTGRAPFTIPETV